MVMSCQSSPLLRTCPEGPVVRAPGPIVPGDKSCNQTPLGPLIAARPAHRVIHCSICSHRQSTRCESGEPSFRAEKLGRSQCGLFPDLGPCSTRRVECIIERPCTCEVFMCIFPRRAGHLGERSFRGEEYSPQSYHHCRQTFQLCTARTFSWR